MRHELRNVLTAVKVRGLAKHCVSTAGDAEFLVLTAAEQMAAG